MRLKHFHLLIFHNKIFYLFSPLYLHYIFPGAVNSSDKYYLDCQYNTPKKKTNSIISLYIKIYLKAISFVCIS